MGIVWEKTDGHSLFMVTGTNVTDRKNPCRKCGDKEKELK